MTPEHQPIPGENWFKSTYSGSQGDCVPPATILLLWSTSGAEVDHRSKITANRSRSLPGPHPEPLPPSSGRSMTPVMPGSVWNAEKTRDRSDYHSPTLRT